MRALSSSQLGGRDIYMRQQERVTPKLLANTLSKMKETDISTTPYLRDELVGMAGGNL